MKRWIALVALTASVALPPAAGAQPQGQYHPPSPEVRAKMQKIFGDARTAALNALSAEHRSKVQAIADQAAARTLDRQAAAGQIDALLTPAEKTAVLAVEQKLRSDMRASMGAYGPPPGGPPPGAGPPPGGPPPGGPPPGGGPPGMMRDRTPDAGRFLMMIARPVRFQGPEPRSSNAP